MTVQPTESILIVDFGSQVTQLIARRVREAGVYCEIAPFNAAEEAFERLQPEGHHLLRRAGVGDLRRTARARRRSCSTAAFRCSASATASRRCTSSSAARSSPPTRRSSAAPSSRSSRPRALFDGLWNVGEKHQVWMSHGDRVETLAPGFEVVASSEGAPFAIATNEERQALQPDVPPRGRAHARRRQAARQFRAPRLRLRGRLDDGRASATPRSPTSASRSARAG